MDTVHSGIATTWLRAGIQYVLNKKWFKECSPDPSHVEMEESFTSGLLVDCF